MRPRQLVRFVVLLLASTFTGLTASSTSHGFGRSVAAAAAPRKLALLIGINQYRAVTNLRGCVNDIERMKALLITKFQFDEADITTLRDQQATYGGIIGALSDLATKAGPDDTIVVHYSGHGSRMEDESGDELDGLDETLVAHDSRVGNVRDVRDDEVNEFLQKVTAKTQNVTLILDSCHSGSASRGGALARRAPDDVRAMSKPRLGARSAEGVSDFRPSSASYVLISGSRPHELSNEFDQDGVRLGALTYHLTSAMNEATATTTYRDVIERIREKVTTRFPSQHPDIEGAGDRVLFGTQEILPEPYVVVNPRAANSVAIAAGQVHGLVVGSELDVYAPGTRVFDSTAARVARVRTTKVDGVESIADVIDGSSVANGSRAVVRSRRYPEEKLRVFFLEREGSKVLPAVRAKLGEFAFVTRVDDESAADIRMREESGFIFTESADLIQLSPPFKSSDADAVQRTLDRITGWAKWFSVLRLRNPDGGLPIRMSVGNNTSRFRDGDRIEIVVENLSQKNVYVTLLDLEVDGRISAISAPTSMNDFVPPSGVLRRQVDMAVTDERVWVPDVIKAIVTTVPLDPVMFTMGAIRSASPVTAPADPLAAFIHASVVGRSRAARPAVASEWGSAERRIETHRAESPQATAPSGLPRAAQFDSFILHFGDASRADPRAVVSQGLTPCGDRQRPDSCWEITQLPGIAAAEVRPAGRSDGSRAPISLGQAWQEAYALRDKTGAEFVEPVFEVPLEPDAPERSGGRADAPAPDDREWSLKYIDAPGAIALLRKLGKVQGQEAAGIVLGHPDTGYREHPEIWNADESKSPLLFTKGWNFVEDNDRPLDPLADSGIVPNPGHGTKSGSVIFSPPGKQWSSNDPKEFVSGVAPGARAVPLRVHTSVVQINSGRLANAILHAVEPDGVHVRLDKPVDLISIAMGGLPTFALYKAVRRAEEKGVVVIAAAGNQVKVVVWPARFNQTIAVAATNVLCKTWSGSSHGGAVDIAAPGESVWHASVDTAGTFGIQPGAGTTYATGTTAGTAALWLARHAGDPTLARLKQEGRLTETLRWMMQQTSWKPGDASVPAGVSCANDATWDSSEYGAGIINAARLLSAPLQEPPGGRAVRAEPEFPVTASIFNPEVPPDEATRRIRLLLRGSPPPQQRQFDVELATLYAIDPGVREALDAITGVDAPAEPAYDRARSAIAAADSSSALRAVVGAR